MQGVLEQAQIAVSQAINKKVAVVSSGAITSAGIVTPANKYNEYLITHGTEMLSWAEWMKVVGAIYVLVLIYNVMLKPTIITIYKKIRSFLNK